MSRKRGGCVKIGTPSSFYVFMLLLNLPLWNEHPFAVFDVDALRGGGHGYTLQRIKPAHALGVFPFVR